MDKKKQRIAPKPAGCESSAFPYFRVSTMNVPPPGFQFSEHLTLSCILLLTSVFRLETRQDIWHRLCESPYSGSKELAGAARVVPGNVWEGKISRSANVR